MGGRLLITLFRVGADRVGKWAENGGLKGVNCQVDVLKSGESEKDLKKRSANSLIFKKYCLSLHPLNRACRVAKCLDASD